MNFAGKIIVLACLGLLVVGCRKNNPVNAGSTISITSVAFSGSIGQNMGIDVKGTGFGSAPVTMPYSGTLEQFSFLAGNFPNATHGFEAGYIGDAVGLNYVSWTDNEIVISGFGSWYGSGNWYMMPGDSVYVRVSQTDVYPDSSQRAIWKGVLP